MAFLAWSSNRISVIHVGRICAPTQAIHFVQESCLFGHNEIENNNVIPMPLVPVHLGQGSSQIGRSGNAFLILSTPEQQQVYCV